MRAVYLLAFILASLPAQAEKQVTYVGGGRYLCSGSSSECASTRRNNDEVTRRNDQRMQQDRRLEQRLAEERRQTRVLEQIRDSLQTK